MTNTGRMHTGEWKAQVSVSELLWKRVTPCSDDNVTNQKRVHKDEWGEIEF